MKLDITTNRDFYKSDAIHHGRSIGSFFDRLSENIFRKSYYYYAKHKEIMGDAELPLLYNEENLYSIFAASINEITPVHLTEWAFTPSGTDKSRNTRFVDFWCLHKEGAHGKPLNYFIEIKKGEYCLNRRSKEDLNDKLVSSISSMITQTSKIKKISPKWGGVDDVYLGIAIVHGYYLDGKEHYDDSHVAKQLHGIIDKRKNAQVLFSTWKFSDDMEIQWEKYKCRFVSIAGVAVSKKRVAVDVKREEEHTA